jgi:hypothetical protein
MSLKYLLLLCVVHLGCGVALTMKDWHDQTYEKFKTDSLQRSSFELQCPAGSLEVTDLTPEQAGPGQQVGVRGCGKQAVYVFTESAGWMNNTGAQNSGQGK